MRRGAGTAAALAVSAAAAMMSAGPATAAGQHQVAPAVGQPRVAAGRAAGHAAPAPAASGNALSSWQTNGLVKKLAYAGGWIYAGGSFTAEMAPGDPASSLSGHQAYLARFSSPAGTFDPAFSPLFTNAVSPASVKVTALAIAPDGKTLYVGGDFTDVTIGTKVFPRSYGAAFDLTVSPPALTSWNPKANGVILAIAPSPDGSTAYLGGEFSRLGTAARPFAGAVDAATGATVTPWAPAVDKVVDAIAVAPDDAAVLVGGYFTTFNGQSLQGIGSTDPAAGTAVNPWPNILPAGQTDNSQVLDIVIGPATPASPDGVGYVAVQGAGRGNFDGDYAADIRTGAQLWESDCFGDTQALLLLGGWLYKASHASDCGYAPAGFPLARSGSGAPVAHHLLDQSPADGSLAFWNPNTNGGPAPNDLGPYAFATDGSALFVGGDFSLVNHKQQEGIAIFGAKPAGSADATPPGRPAAPAVVSTSAGTDSVMVHGVADRDDGLLTYRFYRDGTFFGSRRAISRPWATPVLHVRDSPLTAGRQHSYTVRACDASGACSGFSPPSSPVTVSGSNPEPYLRRVLADRPSFLWTLTETSGSTAFDATRNGHRGSYQPGTRQGVRPGPIAGSDFPATGFTGGTVGGGLVTAQRPVTAPTAFSIELWFQSGTLTGGELAGFSSAQTGAVATVYDRQIWMTNDGQLAFGVHGKGQTVLSPNAYNDGRWHYVVATFSPASGVALYVDGVLAASKPASVAGTYRGFWRVGGGDLNGWSLDNEPNTRPATAPNDFFITGNIADFAIYPAVLSRAQVAAHWAGNYLSH